MIKFYIDIVPSSMIIIKFNKVFPYLSLERSSVNSPYYLSVFSRWFMSFVWVFNNVTVTIYFHNLTILRKSIKLGNLIYFESIIIGWKQLFIISIPIFRDRILLFDGHDPTIRVCFWFVPISNLFQETVSLKQLGPPPELHGRAGGGGNYDCGHHMFVPTARRLVLGSPASPARRGWVARTHGTRRTAQPTTVAPRLDW